MRKWRDVFLGIFYLSNGLVSHTSPPLSFNFYAIFVLSMLFLVLIWYHFLLNLLCLPHLPHLLLIIIILLLAPLYSVLSTSCIGFVFFTSPPSSTPLPSPTPNNQSLCDFIVTNFSKYMKQNSEYLSPSFYTHSRGDKLYLSVFANGRNNGKGTHVSIYATLMRGEDDDKLKWPFEGDVVELHNWKEDKGHTTKTLFLFQSIAAARMNVNWDVICSSPLHLVI